MRLGGVVESELGFIRFWPQYWDAVRLVSRHFENSRSYSIHPK
jgi:hypothetical protein